MQPSKRDICTISCLWEAKLEREKTVIAQIAETVLGGDQQPHTPQRGVLGDDMFNSLE